MFIFTFSWINQIIFMLIKKAKLSCKSPKQPHSTATANTKKSLFWFLLGATFKLFDSDSPSNQILSSVGFPHCVEYACAPLAHSLRPLTRINSHYIVAISLKPILVIVLLTQKCCWRSISKKKKKLTDHSFALSLQNSVMELLVWRERISFFFST